MSKILVVVILVALNSIACQSYSTGLQQSVARADETAATGALRKATIDTVSGSILVDSTGEVSSVSLNTISGSGTVRLDEGHPANYVVHSVSGRLQIDGTVRSGMSGFTTNYAGSIGELSGRFVDVRANSVSGNLTVLRRTAVPTPDAANDEEEEW